MLNKYNNSGFSLVELMVAVAIIGVLALMSVGQVEKQIARSRQAEAKTNLAQVYLAEKTFFAQWSEYTSRFPALGALYDGPLRYDVGFGTDYFGASGTGPGGYTGSPSTATDINASAVCAPVVPTAPCEMVSTHGMSPTVPTSTINATTFNAEAHAYIYSSAQIDIWQINQDKIITNSTPGIP